MTYSSLSDEKKKIGEKKGIHSQETIKWQLKSLRNVRIKYLSFKKPSREGHVQIRKADEEKLRVDDLLKKNFSSLHMPRTNP